MGIWRRGMAAVMLVMVGVNLSGCALAALFAGKGTQEALFKFGKDERVLVLVDVRDGMAPPPAFASTLADKIGVHLFENKAVNHVVPQDRLTALEHQDPVRYKAMGIADIAAATDADAVLRVYLTQLDVTMTSEQLVAKGDAEIFIKVVDRHGTRLYPADPLGEKVDANLDSELVSDRDREATLKELSDLLALRTGRMFHSYSLDNNAMKK